MTDGRNIITFDHVRDATEAQISELSVEDICLLRDNLSERDNAIKADEALLKHIMETKFAGIAEVAYKAAEKETGKVTTLISVTHNLACERKKVVSWDAEKLAVLYSKIGQAGDNPEVYIQRTISTAYTVSEAAHKGWPDEIKAAFEPARTVKTGPLQMSIQPKTKEKSK